MKKHKFLFIFICTINSAFGQFYDAGWALGYSGLTPGQINTRANINFSGPIPIVDTVQREMQLGQPNSSIADSTGALVMISNGCSILNVNGDTMVNGDSLNPGQCTTDYCQIGGIIVQGQLIVPDPVQNNKFWLFHKTCNYATNGYPVRLYYSTIDLSLDSGRGEVTTKNQIAVSDTLDVGYLSATKHANGIFWWIVVHKAFSTTFISFLLTDTGLVGPMYQDAGILLPNPDHGTSTFSPDGETFASAYYNRDISLFHFDRCTGTITYDQIIDIPDTVYITNIEFSESGRYLYASIRWKIYQYDLQSTNIPASKIVVANFDGYQFNPGWPTYFLYPKRAANGKIYINSWSGGNVLHVINYPDSAGLACQVIQHQIILPCYVDNIPNYPNYRLGALQTECDSIVNLSDDEILARSIVIYPNPFNSSFTIQSNSKTEKLLEVSVFTPQGVLINVISDAKMIYLNEPPGIYFVKILFESGKSITKKVIKY